tara:strand:- start:644 stop:1387 length:744 start_codon:yes stop_codon:yes gene_type:complete
MFFFRIIIFFLLLFSPVNANTIYNLIKIPNLEIYQDNTSNGLKYLRATKPFKVGIRNNSVDCLNSSLKSIDKKFILIKNNLGRYSPNFLNKINLKFIVLCENLIVSEISAAGVPNHKMRTLIVDINFDKKFFERVLHHEVFHLIYDTHKSYFSENDWKKFNNSEFKYSECSTCSNRLNLNLLEKNNGFFTEYSMSTASEDMAEVFSFMMTDMEAVKYKVSKDPILNKKILFIKNRLVEIDDKFNFIK